MSISILSRLSPVYWLKQRAAVRARKEAALALHHGIMEAARNPVFFVAWGVPDTLDGRFETLCLHTALVLRRLRTHDDALAQTVFDSLFAQLDLNLREMGVGDLGVSHKIKRMAKALYGRMAAYEGGLLQDSQALREALHRNLYGTLPTPPSSQMTDAVIDYIVASVKILDDQPLSALQQGQVEFFNVDNLSRAA